MSETIAVRTRYPQPPPELIAFAISACCAAVISLIHTEKPAWKRKAYSLARPRKFAVDRNHTSLTGDFIRC